MAAIPTPSVSQLRQISLSYAMEQARLPDYPGNFNSVALLSNADDFFKYMTEGTLPRNP